MKKLKTAIALVLIMVCSISVIYAAPSTYNGDVTLSGSMDEAGVFISDISAAYNVENEAGIKTVDVIIDGEVYETMDYAPGSKLNPKETYFKAVTGNVIITKDYLKSIKNATLSHEVKIRVRDAEDTITSSKAAEFMSDTSVTISETEFKSLKLDGNKTESGIYTDAVTASVNAANEKGITSVTWLLDNEQVKKTTDYSPGTEKNPGEESLTEITESFTVSPEDLESEPGDYTHTLTAVVVNGLGQKSTESISFKANVTKPVISFENTEKSYSKDFKLTIKVSDKNAEDALLEAVIQKDGREVYKASGNAFIEYETEGEGEYTVYAKATDNAGHTDEKNMTFVIEKTKPSVSDLEITGEGNEWFTGDVKISSKLSDEFGIRSAVLTINGEEAAKLENGGTECTFEHVLTKEALAGTDACEAVLTVTDNSGNVQTKSDAFYTSKPAALKAAATTVTIDSLEITGTLKDGCDWYGDTVTLSATASDPDSVIASFVLNVNGKTVATADPATPLEVTCTLDAAWFEENASSDNLYTVEAVSTDTNGLTGKVTKTFNADVEVPAVTIEGITDGYASDPVIKITDNADSAVSVKVKKDGGAEETFVKTGKTSYKLSEIITIDGSSYEITVYATDPAGNKSSEVTETFSVDTAGPVITGPSFDGTKITGTEYYDGDVKIDFSAADAGSGIASLTLTVNDVKVFEEANTSGTVTLDKDWFTEHAVASGEYIAKVTALDKLGNKTEKSTDFLVNFSEPVVELSGITKAFTNQAPTLTVNVSEPVVSNVTTTVTITKDGAAFDSVTSTENEITYEKFTEDGLYEISVTAKNANGKASETKTASFTKDTAKPVSGEITFTGSGASWFSGDVGASIPASDALSGLESAVITVNGKEVKTETLTGEKSKDITHTITKDWLSKNKSNDGSYEVVITLKDRAGNTQSASKSFNADVGVPEVSLKGITNGSFVNKAQTLTVTTSDDYLDNVTTTVQINKDGSVYKTITEKNKETITFDKFDDDGLYEITVTAADLAGNTSEPKTLTFTKDTVKPGLTPVALSGNMKSGFTWYDGQVGLASSASDAGSKIKSYEITVNGISVVNTQCNGTESENISHELTSAWFEQNMSDDGRYDVTVTVTDRAGNSQSVIDTFYADLKAPAVSLSGIEAGSFLNENPTLTVTTEDNYVSKTTNYITINKDGKLFHKEEADGAKYTFSNFNSDGNYDISVYACDKAGNLSETKSVSFVKDTTAPVLSISGAQNNEYYNTDKTISVTVNERNYQNVSVDVKSDKVLREQTTNLTFGEVKPDKENYTASNTYSQTGTYTIRASAKDAAGNTAEVKTLTFTVDKEKPVVDITQVSNQNNYRSTVAPKAEYEDDYLDDVKITLSRGSGKSADGLSFKDNQSTYKGDRTYSNFTKNKEYDDIYTLNCTVSDKAGNVESKQVTFAVNRFGSVFELSDAAKKLNGKFVNKLNGNVVIHEKNISGLDSQEVYVYKDGARVESPVDITESSEGGWQKYSYSIEKSAFKDEGVYTVNIISKDRAGNTSEYMSGGKTPFKFYVDKTDPMISVTGIEEGETYKDGAVAKVKVTDAIAIKSCKVTIEEDGKIILNKKLDTKGDEFNMPKGRDMTVTVTASDEAGNTGKVTVDDVTVGKSSGIFKIIGLGLAALVLCGGILLLAKKRKKDENNT